MPSLSPRPAHTAADANRRGPLATPAEVAEYLGVPVKNAWLNAQAAYDLAV
ncbi:hypothetical protein [Streptomyces sp. NPDC057381]|uniref:hypothetical protein n=1 Tax=Streptomyces sp. NPDC057381 TaxID=3346111 RepID=UPI0036307380